MRNPAGLALVPAPQGDLRINAWSFLLAQTATIIASGLGAGPLLWPSLQIRDQSQACATL